MYNTIIYLRVTCYFRPTAMDKIFPKVLLEEQVPRCILVDRVYPEKRQKLSVTRYF